LICIQDPDISYSDLFDWLRTDKVYQPGGSLPFLGKVTRLLSSRYFCRVWIIQEVALARAALLHVNNDSVLLSQSFLQRLWDLCAHHHVKVPKVLRLVPGEKRETDLLGWLAATVECKSTEPQDKVYAIRSLTDPETRDLVPIDYALKPHQVFANALAAIIKHRKSLAVLSYVRLREEEDTRTATALSSTRFWDYLLETASLEESTVSSFITTIDEFTDGVPLCAQFNGEHEGPWHASVQMQGTRHLPMKTLKRKTPTPTLATVEIATQSSKTPRLNILPRLKARAHFIDVVGSRRLLTKLPTDEADSELQPVPDHEASYYHACDLAYEFFSGDPNVVPDLCSWTAQYFVQNREHGSPVCNMVDMRSFSRTRDCVHRKRFLRLIVVSNSQCRAFEKVMRYGQ
jgi:hypothetical protein